jgi:2-polyprenyl-6-methoxyphenol hydroxylase-like FAD-dependent oxidoreductase
VLKFTATIPDWPKERNMLIEATPDGAIVDFKLVWRDPEPQWVSPGGRLVQIGDAAHTFLPSSANGATQGIEDAVSLAACLHVAGKGNIPMAVKVHNLLR